VHGRIERVLEALALAEVRYLVVGGVAVVLHGHMRTTLDLDLVLHLDSENVSRALQVFESLGFQSRVPVPLQSFANPEDRKAWQHEKNMTVFSLWHPDQPGFAVDLFLQEPFNFEQVYRRALIVPLGDHGVTVVSIADLVEMKARAGRPQDRQDIEALRRLKPTDRDDLKE
jgi:hypothetical protein